MNHAAELVQQDRHVLHPLQHPSDHEDPIVLVEGKGVTVRDAEGREYLDAFAGLWNVLAGHGRRELAQAAAARQLEETILAEGPETVAAVIAEPVMGAGGVIVPPADYFPLVRALCDRYQVLLIADEVITGFGRTGRLFGLHHWGVAPDIMTFAKGVTSGYLPLGGMQISDAIRDALLAAPPDRRWMHAFTYSAHPTCCAVALANLEILEREQLVARAAERGDYLLRQLETLREFPCVGEVRGLGLMAAVEFVADRTTKAPAGIGPRVLSAARERGVLARVRGDVLMLSPPLIISQAEIDRVVAVLRESIRSVQS